MAKKPVVKSSSVIKIESNYRAINSPDIVRSNFFSYLKFDFMYGGDWIHPITAEHFTQGMILEKLITLKHSDPQSYKALWVLWTTHETRTFIADRLNYSGSTLRRIWDRGIDTLILLLLFPMLDVGHIDVSRGY